MKMTTLPEEFQNEHIQYALEVEQALSSLESNLHNSDDPEEIITTEFGETDNNYIYGGKVWFLGPCRL